MTSARALLVVLVCLQSQSSSEAQATLPDREPFYIAPVVEGIFECLAARRHPDPDKYFHADSLCALQRYDTAAALNRLLDPLEPGGAAGKVKLGYTATIPLLGLYRKSDGRWLIDTAKVDDYMALISNIQRPVVVYLVADHFDTRGPLPEELATDKSNLLQLASGAAPSADYYGNKVTPYTLLTDEDIPVNRYRFEAARYVAKRLAALPAPVKDQIIAVTMAGELHHMFRDFEAGMGAFESAQVTDYHPRSVRQFRDWLKLKYGSVTAFNILHGFTYKEFHAVPAPAKNIRSEKLNSFGEHYDGFAHGELPVSGWLWDPARKVDKLELLIDGRAVGSISRGLNRLDVYRAVEEVNSPNVGFRADLVFHQLPHGRHVGQVVAHSQSRRYLIGQFDFNFIGRDQGQLPPARFRAQTTISSIEHLSNVKAWLDLPESPQDVYFNPLARDWNEFRADQVVGLLAKFHSIAIEAGIARNKLYSHQIVPEVNSSWNSQLFAVDKSLSRGLPWHSGLNMYGGATDSDWMRKLIKRRKLGGYGVPEFNPQQWKRPRVHQEAMVSHYVGGARFISPYYLSITSALNLTSRKELSRMEIRPDNEVEGSAAFYQAIRELASQ